MNDLFRGYDLTSVAEHVARKEFERARAAGALGIKDDQEWDTLPGIVKHRFKAHLLPIVTDVLDALEAAKPNAPIQMVEYGYLDGDRDDPRFYENQPDQDDPAKATVWALHLHVPGDADKNNILQRLALLGEITGEYTYGDSWRQWGEVSEGDGDRHMVVYFNAEPERAAGLGLHLATHATFAVRATPYADVMIEHAITTAGDYAELASNSD